MEIIVAVASDMGEIALTNPYNGNLGFRLMLTHLRPFLGRKWFTRNGRATAPARTRNRGVQTHAERTYKEIIVAVAPDKGEIHARS